MPAWGWGSFRLIHNYCNGYCPDNFLLDDCGSCWQNFCYTFFSPGLNDDPTHSVYYDLNASECESYGYSYYEADHPSSPHWNSKSGQSSYYHWYFL